jgi:hypothetical protein
MFGLFAARRNKIVGSYLENMVRSGVLEADVPDLYFEAACRYAQDHGGKLYDDMRDSIIFDKELFGQNYSVFFHVGRGRKGVNITLTRRRPSAEIASEEAEEFVRQANASVDQSGRPPSYERVRQCVLESLETRKVVRFMPATAEEIQGFFETCATSIRSKFETNRVGVIYLGILDVPGAGILIVFGALMRREGIIHTLGRLPTKPGEDPANVLLEKRLELQEFMDEHFEVYRKSIEDEIDRGG